jgi:dethiobiotin synthetase
MHGLLISGTDTGVGKTVFTAALARLWRRQGRRFRVCKPVATGAALHQGAWRSEDTQALAEAAGDDDLDAITPWIFAEPAAPPVAARMAGSALCLEDLLAAIQRRAAGGNTVLVEAVGGLLCPLTETETVADLAAQLELPLVLVSRRALGTLNHTLLAVEVALARGLPLVGVVVNATRPVQGLAEETCVEELRRRLATPVLASLPYQEQPHADLAGPLDADSWWQLAQGEHAADLAPRTRT